MSTCASAQCVRFSAWLTELSPHSAQVVSAAGVVVFLLFLLLVVVVQIKGGGLGGLGQGVQAVAVRAVAAARAALLLPLLPLLPQLLFVLLLQFADFPVALGEEVFAFRPILDLLVADVLVSGCRLLRRKRKGKGKSSLAFSGLTKA